MKSNTMRKCAGLMAGTLAFLLFTLADGMASNIKEEYVNYTANGKELKGFVAWDGSINGKRPVILVVHEWWGLNEYARMRARKLAELGYFAMAVDMYGDGKTAADPGEAAKLASPFYKDPESITGLLDAAKAKALEFPQADPENIAAVGYCFGGYVVLNYVKMGAGLKGVVSFHGGLGGVPADKKLLKAELLVCHGGADKFVSQQDVNGFRHQMDSIGAKYTFRTYANATHAFTNPDATATGKKFNMPIEYNATADKDSWADMKTFLARIFHK